MINVTVWNEYRHEKTDEHVRKIYPEGIHGCISIFLGEDKKLEIKTATFEEAEHGLSEEVLENTDVLVFWNHALQNEFSDEVAERVKKQVLSGMGLVVLHSGHYSKIMQKLLGTTMTLKWKNNDSEKVFVQTPITPLQRVYRRFSIYQMRKCTANFLTYQSLMMLFLQAGSSRVRCSAQAAPLRGAWERFSISSRVMKNTPIITSPLCRKLSLMRCIGVRVIQEEASL